MENIKQKLNMSTKTMKEKDLFDIIDFGVRLGAERAKAEHKKAGQSIAIWKDGKVVKIPPEEIKFSDEFKDLI